MIYYLFVINVITFAAFGLDKRKAKKPKIPDQGERIARAGADRRIPWSNGRDVPVSS